MSSESEEEDNFTPNHQFNGQQTEIVVEYVAAITRFISRFLEKNAKEQRKAIRKKKRKAKMKKSKDNLQTCIQKLCNTIKETFSPFYVQSEMPGCSRQSIVPVSSQNDTGIPKTSKSNTETAVPGSSKSYIETGASKSSAETMHSNGQAKAVPEASRNHGKTIRISSERNVTDTTGNLRNVIDAVTQSTIPIPEARSSPGTTKSIAAPGTSRSHTDISGKSVTSTSTTDAMHNSSGQAKAVPVTSSNHSQHAKSNSIDNVRSSNHTETSRNLSDCNEKIVHATAKNSIPEAKSTTKPADFRSSATAISEMLNSRECTPTGSHTNPVSGSVFPDNRITASCGIFESHAEQNPKPTRSNIETTRVSKTTEIPGTSRCNAETVLPGTPKRYTATGKVPRNRTESMQHPSDQTKEVPAPSKSFQKSTNISKHHNKTPGNLTNCIDKIVPEASKIHSDAAEFRASIHTKTKTVVPENSGALGNFTKLTPVTSKGPTGTDSGTEDCTRNVLTKTNTVGSKVPSNVTKTILDHSKNSTETSPNTSTSYAGKNMSNTSKGLAKTCLEKSKPCTGTSGTTNSVSSQSTTNIVYRPNVGNPKKTVPGFRENRAECSGSSKSNSETKSPESSRKNTQTDITTTAINRSHIAKSETSIQNKTISSTKVIPETSESSIRAAPVSKYNTEKVETKNPENVLKAGKESPNNRADSTTSVTSLNAKVIHETSKSPIADSSVAIPNNTEVQNTISNNVLNIGKGTPKNLTEITKSVTFKENKAIAVEAGKPVVAQNRTEVGHYSRSNSGSGAPEASSNFPKAGTSKPVPPVEPSTLNRCKDNTKNDNSKIHMQEHVMNVENYKRNDNTATIKRNTEANLKRNHTSPINDEPKRARIKYKCSICGKSISNNKAAKHYKKKHGIHHEMKHNSENYEHKMKGLKRRLSDPVKRKEKKSENEQGEIKTVVSEKISLKSPNECIKQSVANITPIEFADTDKLNEPVAKKKRAITIITSFKAEVNRETVLDVYTIDLTEDNDLDGPEPPKNVSVKNCDSKPVEDDHTLNDHLFIDPSNDTSLYETPLENETKSAEAFLMKNVKEEGADSQLDTDIEVVSNFFPTLSNQTLTVRANLINTEPNTKKIKQTRIQGDSLRKRNSTEAVVPGSDKVVPGSSKNTTKNILKANPQSAKATVSGNPLNRLDVRSRDADGTKLAAAKIGHSKTAAISPIEQTNQKVTQDKLLHKRNEGSTRKLPCEMARSNKKDPNNVSIATNRDRKAPKVPMLNSATSITNTSTHSTHEAKSKNHTYRADSSINKLKDFFFTGTPFRGLSPEVSASTSNSTAGTSKQLKEEAKQSNDENDLMTNLAIHGLTITAVNVPSVSNSTSPADKPTSRASTSASNQASQNITTAHRQEPQTKRNSSTKRNSCKRIEKDISFQGSPPRHESVVKHKEIPPIKNSANVQKNQTGSSAQNLEHEQNGLSQYRDKKTDDISTGQNVSNKSSERKTPDHKQKHLPQKTKPNSSNSTPPKQEPSKLKQNSCQRIEIDISSAASHSRRESATDPRKEKPFPNVQTNQTGYSVQNSEHQQNRLSQPRDKNTESTSIGFSQNTSIRSSELNQRQNTERPIKEVHQTHSTTSQRSNAESSRERNLTNIQTPQIAWSPPRPIETQHLKRIPPNTNRSNIAERMSNRRGSTHNNTPPRRYSWHIPVEPEEIPVQQNITENVTLKPVSRPSQTGNPGQQTERRIPHGITASVTLNPVSRQSPQPGTSEEPTEPRIPNGNRLPSTSEVGQPILVLRHASTMIDRRRSNPQSDRTWHIPEEERTQK